MEDTDTLYRFYKQVKDMVNNSKGVYDTFYNLKAMVNGLSVELNTSTQEEKPNDTTNLLGFILKTQLEIQKEKDPRVLYCKDVLSEIIDGCPLIKKDKEIFFKTLFDFAHALGKEASELEDETAWKGWTKYLGNSWDKIEGNEPFSSEHIYNMRMEAIDCLKFLAVIFIILDMDLEMIQKMFIKKTNIKILEWENEK